MKTSLVNYTIPDNQQNIVLSLANVPAGYYALKAHAVISWRTGSANQGTVGLIGNNGMVSTSFVEASADHGGGAGQWEKGISLDQVNLTPYSAGGQNTHALILIEGKINVSVGGSLDLWVQWSDLVTGGPDNDTIKLELASIELIPA